MSLVATLKNKHLVVALLVAPLLAVFAWYGVGWISGDVAEEPVPAEPGASYPLIERPGCRYAGGACALSNEDFELTITLTDTGVVNVISAVPLESLLVGLGSQANAQPGLARPVSGGLTEWRYPLGTLPASEDSVRFVAVAQGTAYFGEASLVFTETPDR